MKPVVYIAGPITNGGTADKATMRRNCDAANEVYHKLVAGGIVAPICPHTMANYQNEIDYELPHDDGHDMWMEICLSILSRCDAVLMLDGWEDSLGSIIEENFARDHGMQVFHTIAEAEEYYA